MADIAEALRDNNDYGNWVRGPDSNYVVLVSSDGFDFVLKRQWIKPSLPLTQMLDIPGGVSNDTVNYVVLQNIESLILRRLCEYFEYKARYTGQRDIPEFPIDTNISVELISASTFLNC